MHFDDAYYHHLMGIAFNGDLSLEDANLLVSYGQKSPAILEFGSGGSTQIFSQCLPKKLVSVETNEFWIERTKKNIGFIKNKTDPIFTSFDSYPKENYDLIFVDGESSLRRQFAIDTWGLLNVGGVMIFHDTKRFEYFADVSWIAQLHFLEIETIEVNKHLSNLTIIRKKRLENYVNWNETEDKPSWAYGAGEPPEEGMLWKIQI